MRRADLEHVIRAAAAITGEDELVVVGSQAILGPHPDAPASLTRSVEADVYPRHRPDLADLIDGAIGEDSMFHETFGYYAQGVGPETAICPAGWEERLVPVRNENTRFATGLCLETHDLIVSKCVAGRDKDVAFLRAAAQAGLVVESTLLERLARTSVGLEMRRATEARIRAAFASL